MRPLPPRTHAPTQRGALLQSEPESVDSLLSGSLVSRPGWGGAGLLLHLQPFSFWGWECVHIKCSRRTAEVIKSHTRKSRGISQPGGAASRREGSSRWDLPHRLTPCSALHMKDFESRKLAAREVQSIRGLECKRRGGGEGSHQGCRRRPRTPLGMHVRPHPSGVPGPAPTGTETETETRNRDRDRAHPKGCSLDCGCSSAS